jgi:hypothetical protein
MSETIQKDIDAYSKSQGIGFIATFFFGPLGLFYSSWLAALILCVIAVSSIVTGALNIVTIILLCWPLSIIISFVSVGKHNEKIKSTTSQNV